jgi:hypothetical protein
VPPSTTIVPEPTAVGTRACSTIWAAPDSANQRIERPADLIVGPVRLNGVLDQKPGKAYLENPGDGTPAQIWKVPLTVFDTPAAAVRIAVADPKNSVRIVYDDQGLRLLSLRQYRFVEGVTSVDIPAPTSCGQPAEGLVQFNGGFVAREPTCVTITAFVDGAEVGRGRAPFAGGVCA